MSDQRLITGWATEELAARLDGLQLCPALQTVWQPGGWVSGEVTIGERKGGKCYPIYTLEVEVPFTRDGGGDVVGSLHLPDISIEMLDDLEVCSPLPLPQESGGSRRGQCSWPPEGG